MKTVDFLGKKITKAIIGDNPFTGHSYIPDIVGGEEMKSFCTTERILQSYAEMEKQGFNTILPLARSDIFAALHEYRKNGGKMNLIFQSCPVEDLDVNIPHMMELSPFGMYHQGTTADYLMETNQAHVLRDNLKKMRQSGAKVGFVSHEPENIARAEDEGWDVDFYMASLYNIRKQQRGQQSGFITGKSKDNIIFYPNDKFEMFKVINQVKKPCIAYKILMGGQVFYGKKPEEYDDVLEETLRQTFENIKENDIVCVGVFQKYSNQIKSLADKIDKIYQN